MAATAWWRTRGTVEEILRRANRNVTVAVDSDSQDTVISEIITGLPGTEPQKVLCSQCGDRHPGLTVWLPAYRPPSKLIKIQVR